MTQTDQQHKGNPLPWNTPEHAWKNQVLYIVPSHEALALLAASIPAMVRRPLEGDGALGADLVAEAWYGLYYDLEDDDRATIDALLADLGVHLIPDPAEA